MAIRVSYGKKDNIDAAIQSGIIPKDSIIITSDDPSGAEMMFYDKEAVMAHIVAQTKFGSVDEAIEYARANSQAGKVITVLEGEKYTSYLVQPDYSITKIGGGQELPVATMESNGVVKGTDAENGVAVSGDGTMSVNSVNITKLVQGDGDEIIFNCGSAAE